MNERIKELAEQNGFIHNWMPPGEQHDKLKNLEKFAELIVKECLEIVEPCKCGCCDGEPEKIICDTITKQIKEHFGVEL